MKENFSPIASSYKLNSAIVRRMTSRVIEDSHHVSHPGCSKLMIATMIHLSHICSSNGVIDTFKVSELTLVLHCNLRSAYTVISELEKREFIKIENVDTWAGVKKIVILNNDFSEVKDYTGMHYLNTNYPFFNYRENAGYEKFLELSLYSMRLLLLLLLNYNTRNGYRVSYDTLCAQLSIKKRFRIHKYMTELQAVLGKDFFQSSSNTLLRYRHGNILIERYNQSLTPEKTFDVSQDTYYLHKWKQKLTNYGFAAFTKEGSLHYYCYRICGIITTFLKKNLNITLIENTVTKIILDQYILDDQTLTDIYKRLNFLSPS